MYGSFLLQNLICEKIPGLCVTWRRRRGNLQSFALQLHVLGKNVITLITFSVCVTPVANHMLQGFSLSTLRGKKESKFTLSCFFPFFFSFPPCQPLGLHTWLCTGALVTLTASSRVELKFPPGQLNRNSE